MMSNVVLTGALVCRTDAEAAIVRRHLPEHIDLTRSEPGCLAFDVEPSDDAMVWTVHERFVDEAAFKAHQERVSQSDWGRATAGIERRYKVTGLES